MTAKDGLPRCYAVVNGSDAELMASSSGGAFSLLARHVLDQGGVVYGHAFVSLHAVECVRIVDEAGLAPLRGSKYVQSSMGDAYAEVRADLRAGRPVLFTGTPCQVDALRGYLGGESGGLLTADIVCHGVPSPVFFKDCMEYEFGDAFRTVRFRDKREGWGCGGVVVVVFSKSGKLLEKPFSPLTSFYYERFLAGDVYRESCYECPYAGGPRPGDFTIGDFWGIDAADAGLDSRRGISAVMVNTPAAEATFAEAFAGARVIEREVGEAVAGNTQLQHPTERTAARDEVMAEWRVHGIAALEDSFRRRTRWSALFWRAKRQVKRLLKAVGLR